MPGSPPTNVADPGTKPPPSTRSNSPMPDRRRGCVSCAPFRGTNSTFADLLLPLRLLLPRISPRPLGGPLFMASSTKGFQLPPASHLPAHLEAVAPHSWHEKRVLDLDIAILFTICSFVSRYEHAGNIVVFE